ncbi:Cof-type HAD-IIB family hydrolase [Halalkalibacter urbisdiaboli]|uniref:Cof-type HAD-IIB family hydrolase n=1 Tax=Halalkalibacter urbisdiaboli TaxID=1960589 RepID=UPI000B453B4B|nr:Cof-type HAD-IIB family hydrolase [Halalkalibacter urbisdiaboli]
MNKKVVFFDIDGTLLNEEKKLPISTKKAISDLQNQGVYVAIATGRAPFMFKELREELGINTFVSFNGSYVVFEGEMVDHTPLTTKELIKLEQSAEKMAHSMVFLDHLGATSNRKEDPYVAEGMGSLKLPYPTYEPNGYQSKHIYQALLFCEEHDELQYRNKHSHFDYIRWHQFSIDVIPSGGSKARGIQSLLKHLSLAPEHAYAFGDALNDLEMLEFVGTGIAMGNAMDEAKAAANYVTKAVDEDGIMHGLKQVGLLK